MAVAILADSPERVPGGMQINSLTDSGRFREAGFAETDQPGEQAGSHFQLPEQRRYLFRDRFALEHNVKYPGLKARTIGGAFFRGNGVLRSIHRV